MKAQQQSLSQSHGKDYFKKLQGQLLQKSNKYTSLIGKNLYTNPFNTSNNRKMTAVNVSSECSHFAQQSAQKQQYYQNSASNKKYKKDSIGNKSLINFRQQNYRTTHGGQGQRPSTKNFQQNLSLQDLHKNLQQSYEAYISKANAHNSTAFNKKNMGQYFSKEAQMTDRQELQIKVQNTLNANAKSNSKAQLKISSKLKSLLNACKNSKTQRRKDSGVEINRKLVYNLTFDDDSNQTIFQDSPEKLSFGKYDNDQINGSKMPSLGSKMKQTGRAMSRSKQQRIYNLNKQFNLNSQVKESYVRPRKNSKLGCQNLGQTVSTKFSYTGKDQRFSDRNLSKKSNASTDLIQQVNDLKKARQKNKTDYKPLKTQQSQKQIIVSNQIKRFQNSIFDLKVKKQKQQNTSNSHKQLQSGVIDSKHLRLSDFDIMGELGHGKVGTVYVTRHKKSKFMCALKVIPKNIVDKFMIVQLIRQIKVQMFLDHPNIVQLYSFFTDHENIYLVLQLCFSGNLYTYLRKQSILPELEIRPIIKQVCHALQYMHDNDILHRDLKPQNILFHEKIIKLCDFGWSVYSPLMRDTQCGTPIYSSPQIVEKKQYNNKIDVWNIGILTYQLLCGRVPFQIRSQSDLYRVVNEQINFPQSIPISDQCKKFIRACLMKNPEERYTIFQLLKHPFMRNSDS